MTRLLTPLARAVFLTVFCAILIAPLLSGMMFETADGTLHLYRLIALRHALSEGDLWVRYVPGMVYGYGAPMFNYYSPLSLYPMLGLNLLGFTPTHAWLVGMAGYLVLAAGGMFALARRWLSPAGALIAAAAYAAAPYTVYDVLWRGTTSEIASLALLPWIMAAMSALAARPTRWRFAIVAGLVALFMPMHNVITLHAAVLLAAFGVLLALQSDDKARTLIRLGLAGVIGALMVSFFWLPAIRETNLVKIDGVTAALPEIEVTRNLAPLSESFEIPDTADPARQQPPAAIALGWPALLLGAVGVIALWRDKRRGLALFCVSGIVVLIFMNTPASAVIWRTIPLIRYSQFPTRLIGLASLLLALLAGAGAAALTQRLTRPIWRGAAYAVILGGLLVYVIPYLYRIPTPETDPRTLVDSQNFERESGYIGTSSFGEYVPRWAETLPDANALIERYAQTEIISRLSPPDGVTITHQEWGLTSAYIFLTADAPTSLVFDWFYLPNWQVWAGGKMLETLPNPSDGRLRVDLPAGESVLDIHWGCTEIECNAEFLSMWALVGLVITVGAWSLLRPLMGRLSADSQPAPVDSANFRPFVIAAAVGLCLLALKGLVIDRVNTPLRADRFGQGYAAGVQTVTDANLNNQLTLIGYDALTSSTQAGDTLNYALIWSARMPIQEDVQVIVKLVTADGVRVSQVDDLAPGGTGTRNWRPGYYLIDRVDLPIPPDTPPGEYHITAEVFRLSDSQTLPVINTAGNPEGVTVSLGSVTVTASNLFTDRPATLTAGDSLALVLAAGLPESVGVGQEIDLRLTWLAEHDLTEADSIVLTWTRGGESLAETDLSDTLSYADWPSGRIYTARHRIYVPGDLTSGEIIPVLRWAGAEYALPSLDVTTPDRIFAIPDAFIPSEAVWDNGITLLGYLDSADGITLVWRTDSPQAQPLRRFAHHIDAAGQIQHVTDGVPVDWTRPVMGWAVGEIIIDPVGILGEGLTLRVGWVAPRTNTRIIIGDSDFFDIP